MAVFWILLGGVYVVSAVSAAVYAHRYCNNDRSQDSQDAPCNHCTHE